MIKPSKTLIMIIGHEKPNYLIDTYESIKHFNKGKNYEIVFAIDFNKAVGETLSKKYGSDHVFVSSTPNGWGRGILKTTIHALDYFKTKISFDNLITFDSDALCVGPFVDHMLSKIDSTDVFFVGAIWHSPGKDHGFHHSLRASGFMHNYPFHLRTEMAAGPCMMWTKHCFKFFKSVGLTPAKEFDKIYSNIHFAHDQISTWLISCGVGVIKDIGQIMEIKWRSSLPTFHTDEWGQVPITHNHTAVIHPTKSNRYTEDNCRAYFRSKREGMNKQMEGVWKDYFRNNKISL